MPHVVVKLVAGKTEEQKQRLADEITKNVMRVLEYGEEAISVSMEEVASQDWMDQVYGPEIRAKQETLYKKPGYGSL